MSKRNSFCSDRLIPLKLLPLLPGITACAGLDDAAVGRTDRLTNAPFYVTYERLGIDRPIVAFPITVDPVSGEPFNLAGRGPALQPLLNALNAALAAHSCCRYVESSALPDSGGPRSYLGMLDGEAAPSGTGIDREYYEEYSPMILHSVKSDTAWRVAAAALAEGQNASRILVIQLAFSQFPKADHGFFGKKVVLGTDYEVPVRFFSTVDDPIEVIALTGVLLDRGGNIIRAGGEGIAGYDAPFWVQVFEAGKDIELDAINRLVTSDRREDLPAQPLKWQAALDQLIEQMVGSN